MWMLLLACVARDYLPYGPVTPPGPPPAEAVRYTGPPRVEGLFPPLQAFGIRYDLDLVVVTDHPKWTMHELAHVGGLGWFAKDADPARVQSIVAGLPDLPSFAAEVPVPRVEHEVRVQDRSVGGWIDLRFDYLNADGERVEIEAQGARSERPPRLRNTSTMGHSAQAVSAALDLYARHDTTRVSVSYDGVPARISRIAGAPIQAFIAQTQAGLAACSMSLEPAEGGWTLRRPAAPEEPWPTHGVEDWRQEGPWLVHRGALNAFAYRFEQGGLAEVVVTQRGEPPPEIGDAPTLRLLVEPPLPDLRRPFEGEATRSLTLSIDDQPPHGYGRIHARSTPDGAVLEIEPLAPEWLAERPMRVEHRWTPEGGVVTRCTLETDR